MAERQDACVAPDQVHREGGEAEAEGFAEGFHEGGRHQAVVGGEGDAMVNSARQAMKISSDGVRVRKERVMGFPSSTGRGPAPGPPGVFLPR